MNTYTKHHIDLEYHQIDMALKHIRISDPKALRKLMHSIDAQGLLVPVIVVPSADAANRYTLIDGYLRVGALLKLKQDMIKAEVWECNISDALLTLLAHSGQRQWEAIEQAFALKELHIRYHLSHQVIAKQIGRTQSFISHRIALLEILPDKFIQAVIQGKISVWVACRILVPIARAIPHHADHLFEHLCNHQVSTRNLNEFFKHYQKSNKTVREKMCANPDLYFKAQKEMDAEKSATLLRKGPEGQWFKHIAIMQSQTKYLEKLTSELFYQNQEDKVIQQLLLPIQALQNDLNRLSQIKSLHLITRKPQEIESHDRQNDTSDNHHTTPIGQELSTY